MCLRAYRSLGTGGREQLNPSLSIWGRFATYNFSENRFIPTINIFDST